MTTATTSWLEATLTDHFTARAQVRRVRLATTANHGLSGLAAVDGVVPQAGDRVLAHVQTDDTARLVYVAASGGWAVATDSDGEGDLFPGVEFYVAEGTTYGGTTLRNSATTEPVYPGATALTWDIISGSGFGGVGSITTIDPADTASAGVASASARVDHQHAVTSATLATVSTLVARGASGETDLGYLRLGVAPYATAGDVRLPSAAFVSSRNAADNANRPVIVLDDTGVLAFGSTTAAWATDLQGDTVACTASGAGVTLTASAAGGAVAALAGTGGSLCTLVLDASGAALTCSIAGTNRFSCSSTRFDLNIDNLGWKEGVSAPSLQQAIRTTDALPSPLSVVAQTAYASAAGANKVGAALTLAGGRGATPGTDLAGAVAVNLGSLVGATSGKFKIQSGTLASPTTVLDVQDQSPYLTMLVPASARHLSITSGADLALSCGAGGSWYGIGVAKAQILGPTNLHLDVGSGTRYVRIGHNASTGADSGTESLRVELDGSATSLRFGKGQTSTIYVEAPTTDVAPKDLTCSPAAPFGAATGGNRKPGDMVDALGAPTNSGTTHAQKRTTRGASSIVIEDKGEVTTTDGSATVVYTYTLADTSCVHLRARVLSFRTDTGSNAVADVLEAGAKRRGGGAVLIGTPTTTLKEDAALTLLDATVSGNDLRISISCRGGETWKHRVHVELAVELIS